MNTNVKPVYIKTRIEWKRQNMIKLIGSNLFLATESIREDPQNLNSRGIDIQVKATEDNIKSYTPKISIKINATDPNILINPVANRLKDKWIEYLTDRNMEITSDLETLPPELLTDNELVLQRIRSFFTTKTLQDETLENGSRLITINPVNLDESQQYDISLEIEGDFPQAMPNHSVPQAMPAMTPRSFINPNLSDYYKVNRSLEGYTATLKANGNGAKLYVNQIKRIGCLGGNYETADADSACFEIRNCGRTSIKYTFTCSFTKTLVKDDRAQNSSC